MYSYKVRLFINLKGVNKISNFFWTIKPFKSMKECLSKFIVLFSVYSCDCHGKRDDKGMNIRNTLTLLKELKNFSIEKYLEVTWEQCKIIRDFSWLF